MGMQNEDLDDYIVKLHVISSPAKTPRNDDNWQHSGVFFTHVNIKDKSFKVKTHEDSCT